MTRSARSQRHAHWRRFHGHKLGRFHLGMRILVPSLRSLLKKAVIVRPAHQFSAFRHFSFSIAMNSQPAPLDASRVVIKKSESPKECPAPQNLVFGKTFTDHMLKVSWNKQTGWAEPSIEPYAPLSLEPSAVVLHYAPTLFEGMKAYRDDQGQVRLFRPEKNMERMNRSAKRICLPSFEGEECLKLIMKLIQIDSRWVPSEPGYSLYIRPTLIGTQSSIGISEPTDALLFVILSPVGPYYSSGVKPIALEANPQYVRAWPGGTGDAKLGANYGPSMMPQKEAAARGYSQILWLFGEEDYVTEVGTMNMFAVLKKDDGAWEVVTPPLNGLILPGVTRLSILELLRAHQKGEIQLENVPKIEVNERDITMKEVVEASNSGNLVEMFGAGTAAVVTPVDRIGYKGKDIHVPVTSSGFGTVTEAVLNKIMAIQWGKEPHAWSVPI